MDTVEHSFPGEAGYIEITGAREHNLKNISLRIPRGCFVVITGVSGSGKSTLAFDLLFAEGQRRFLDSMSAYARQFVEQMARPEVDLISGLPPTVSIEQRTSRGGGKSTVATVTEVYHFIRLLYARLGTQFCPDCGIAVEPQTADQVIRGLEAAVANRGDLLLLAPLVRNRKGFHSDLADWAVRAGYKELRADGKMHSLDQPFRLDRFKEHDVEVVIGVLDSPRRGATKGKTPRGRFKPAESDRGQEVRNRVEEALRVGKGLLYALDNSQVLTVHSTERSCPSCRTSFNALDPKTFSYNSSQGWCPRCRGFGELFDLPDVDRGAREGAIEESWFEWTVGSHEPCPECQGSRLNRVAGAVRLNLPGFELPGSSRVEGTRKHPTIHQLCMLPVRDALRLFQGLRLEGKARDIARDVLPEINERLIFLQKVGLGYLHMGRSVTTLSGGESQRIRLAAQLGSNLSGVLYVLDEPTIGLHARDNEQLLQALSLLRSRGNSVVVVEHDDETMRQADWIIDLGPGAGSLGGEVVATGTLEELKRHPTSVTGACLREVRTLPSHGSRRPVQRARTRGRAEGEWLHLGPFTLHNLKGVEVCIPLGRFVTVTGVSGSGKSTLIREGLLPALAQALKRKRDPDAPPGTLAPLRGAGSLRAVHEVDQAPIGRTPRSTPATYVGFFDDIRELFAQTPESRMRGYGAGRFSFNNASGRCPACEGAGVAKLEMNFLPPAFVTCESCHGLRFNAETLDVLHRGKTIADVLNLSVDEGVEFFAVHPRIVRPLLILQETGLGYLRLGQTSPTLSGGEAQRVKLVSHLLEGLKDTSGGGPRASRPHRNFFILEEPTVGLHMSDVRRLVGVVQRLVDAGHSVLVIEHNLELIAESDWVIDLGPEAGEAGGKVVAQGTPETVARVRGSHTGAHLKRILRDKV